MMTKLNEYPFLVNIVIVMVDITDDRPHTKPSPVIIVGLKSYRSQ